jgi:hypothetical protein
VSNFFQKKKYLAEVEDRNMTKLVPAFILIFSLSVVHAQDQFLMRSVFSFPAGSGCVGEPVKADHINRFNGVNTQACTPTGCVQQGAGSREL